jgi:hypothetical protein
MPLPRVSVVQPNPLSVDDGSSYPTKSVAQACCTQSSPRSVTPGAAESVLTEYHNLSLGKYKIIPCALLSLAGLSQLMVSDSPIITRTERM